MHIKTPLNQRTSFVSQVHIARSAQSGIVVLLVTLGSLSTLAGCAADDMLTPPQNAPNMPQPPEPVSVEPFFGPTTPPDLSVPLCSREPTSPIKADLSPFNHTLPANPATLEGRVEQQPATGKWIIRECACDRPCKGDRLWTLTVGAPAGWLPTLPACVRIDQQRYCPGSCGAPNPALRSLVLWDQTQGGRLHYVATEDQPMTPTAVGSAFTVSSQRYGEGDCSGCFGAASYFRVRFEAAGDGVNLEEGQQSTFGLNQYSVYLVQAIQTAWCDVRTSIQWIVRRN